jgi:phosphoglycolate phosphatase
MTNSRQFDAVLFDLDGTLIDTALDMVAILNAQLQDAGRNPIDYKLARSNVSNGSAGLIHLGFPDVSSEEHEQLRCDYLNRYAAAVCVHSTLFPTLADLLQKLENAKIPWGIVTNKPARMTAPLLDALALSSRAACAISGDTIPQRKPDPAPMFLACDQTGVAPKRTVYVGDSIRDIDAGRAAGMFTVAARYGYVTADDNPESWLADVIVNDPQELTRLLLKGVNLHAA